MYKYLVIFLLVTLCLCFEVNGHGGRRRKCCKGKDSITTVSGSQAPKRFCSGDLILDENFNKLNFKLWHHELTLGGGGNWEFQWYTNNRSNSFVKDGKLHIKPTLTAEVIGEEKLFNSSLAIDYCTDSRFYGCQREGKEGYVLNPVRSAKLTTEKSFAFKYGRVQVRAKMPTGDWLQPAIWMLPIDYAYGPWPGSGTIVIAQCRGNPVYYDKYKRNIGAEQIEANLHWGPDVTHDAYETEGTFLKRSPPGKRWDLGFHDYEMEWTPDYIKFLIDGEEFAHVAPNATLWELGHFDDKIKANPYIYGSKMAPCTDFRFWGCLRTGTPTNILNPIRSAKLTTVNSFSFKYGKLQVRAKLPTGDWLWPAIWLLSRYNEYGSWPTSGEIDLMESRGNENLIQNGVNIGVEQMASTLHWGPAPAFNRYERTHFAKNSQTLNKEFKVYELEWTPDSLIFRVDGEHLGTIQPNTSFWNFGDLGQSGMSNPWQYASNLAPFDQEFYIIMNLAVGGTNGFFPDDAQNNPPKPWINTSPQAFTDFWNAKSSWLPTWKLGENNAESASLQVDYVKVWAL